MKVTEDKMMTSTIKALLTAVQSCPNAPSKSCNKITIIGAGSVGTAIAFTLLAKQITDELVLIDKDSNLARGEMLDIQHAIMYLGSPKISSSTDYKASKDSRICVITAGAGSDEPDTEALAKQNTCIFKDIIPKVVAESPNCILIVVSDPVDILSYAAWKLSGFPPHRVIGTGTILESARFRSLLAQHLGIGISACQAFIVGEHGPKAVPVWSGVGVSGVRLSDINKDLGRVADPEDWNEIYDQVLESAQEVKDLKSCGSWGIALSVAEIVTAIVSDKKTCLPISVHVKGCRHGVDKDVFMSLPAVLGSGGVSYVVRQNLNDSEKEMIQTSADAMYVIQKNLGL